MGQGNGHNAIDSLIFINDLQQFASPSTTAVGTTVPSGEDFQRKRTQNLANLVGSIGSPQGLSEEELLEMVMSTSPVGASIRGGKVAKSTMQQLLDLSRKYGIGRPKSKPMTPQDYNFQNKLGVAKMKNRQTLDKYGIEDPDKQGMVDPVSALLNYFSKN
mgnify:CR=1 FL=1